MDAKTMVDIRAGHGLDHSRSYRASYLKVLVYGIADDIAAVGGENR